MIHVVAPDTRAAAAAQHRLDRLTKPPGSLGRLEDLAVQLAATQARPLPQIAHPVVLLAAADHGVAAEGVSPYPQAVTGQMVLNFLAGGAAINALAASVGAALRIVDAGVIADLPGDPRLLRAALRRGTGNLYREPAMTRGEAAAMLRAGMAIVAGIEQLDLLAIGEMGIGNSTSAACLTCVFAGATPEQATGRGTGLDDAGLARKRAVVAGALKRAGARASDPLGALAELGGLEIALLAGALIGAAGRRVPLLLDGYIATAAALAADALEPGLRVHMIAAHRSAEPGHALALAHLGLRPLLELDMRLGEGSGAALAIPIVRAACAVLSEMATFDEAGVDQKPEARSEEQGARSQT